MCGSPRCCPRATCFTPNDSMESTETSSVSVSAELWRRFTPNDSMESTETGNEQHSHKQAPGFTPNDSMESTETRRSLL